MLIEDDNIMLSLIREVLTIMGFKNVKLHKSAQEAFEDIVVNDYDLILCDWKLPGMNGIEFTKKLRNFEKTNKRFTPLIMVTGKAHADDVKEARDAGVTEYMIKPFTVMALSEKIRSILEKPRGFVISDVYAGPDRRRRDDKGSIPGGKDRRGE